MHCSDVEEADYPCQCDPGCEGRGDCCSDYSFVCGEEGMCAFIRLQGSSAKVIFAKLQWRSYAGAWGQPPPVKCLASPACPPTFEWNQEKMGIFQCKVVKTDDFWRVLPPPPLKNAFPPFCPPGEKKVNCYQYDHVFWTEELKWRNRCTCARNVMLMFFKCTIIPYLSN